MLTVKCTSIKQSELSAECWSIQAFGLSACEKCPYKRRGCGGRAIRKTLMNNKGHKVPLGTVESKFAETMEEALRGN
jgi:hypothetical protein